VSHIAEYRKRVNARAAAIASTLTSPPR